MLSFYFTKKHMKILTEVTNVLPNYERLLSFNHYTHAVKFDKWWKEEGEKQFYSFITKQ